jgi:hypothetical protein
VWVRLVWSGRPREIEGVRVRNVKTQTYSSVRPTERLAADIREAFANFVAEDIVAAVCPAPGTVIGQRASSAELLNVTEKLLDPRLLAAEVVRVFVQIARSWPRTDPGRPVHRQPQRTGRRAGRPGG